MKSTYNQAQTANTAKHSGWYYCAFQKHANSKVQKPLSQLRFSLPSIIITITSNEPWNRETHITDRNPPITNHKAWPFEPVRVKFRILRGPSRWLTAAKNAIVSWLLNFRIRMFVKSAVTSVRKKNQSDKFLIRAPYRILKKPSLRRSVAFEASESFIVTYQCLFFNFFWQRSRIWSGHCWMLCQWIDQHCDKY